MVKTLFFALFFAGSVAARADVFARAQLFASPEMRAASAGQCDRMITQAGESVDYCVLGPRASTLPRNIIYYFHGSDGSADEVLNSTFRYIYYAMSLAVGDRIPYIVGISFGSVAPVDFKNGRINELVDEVFPQIEKSLTFSESPTRHLLGGSLGGFSVLDLAAAKPSMFRSVSALCPALIPYDPFSDEDVQWYVERNLKNINIGDFNALVADLRHTYGDKATWDKNDPLRLARLGAYDGVNLFVSVGTEDTFGFNEGVNVLQNILSQRPTQNVRNFALTSGPHCSFSTVALMKFFNSQMY